MKKFSDLDLFDVVSRIRQQTTILSSMALLLFSIGCSQKEAHRESRLHDIHAFGKPAYINNKLDHRPTFYHNDEGLQRLHGLDMKFVEGYWREEPDGHTRSYFLRFLNSGEGIDLPLVIPEGTEPRVQYTGTDMEEHWYNADILYNKQKIGEGTIKFKGHTSKPTDIDPDKLCGSSAQCRLKIRKGRLEGITLGERGVDSDRPVPIKAYEWTFSRLESLSTKYTRVNEVMITDYRSKYRNNLAFSPALTFQLKSRNIKLKGTCVGQGYIEWIGPNGLIISLGHAYVFRRPDQSCPTPNEVKSMSFEELEELKNQALFVRNSYGRGELFVLKKGAVPVLRGSRGGYYTFAKDDFKPAGKIEAKKMYRKTFRTIFELCTGEKYSDNCTIKAPDGRITEVMFGKPTEDSSAR